MSIYFVLKKKIYIYVRLAYVRLIAEGDTPSRYFFVGGGGGLVREILKQPMKVSPQDWFTFDFILCRLGSLSNSTRGIFHVVAEALHASCVPCVMSSAAADAGTRQSRNAGPPEQPRRA